MAMKIFPLTAQDFASRLLGEVGRLGAEYNRTLPNKEGTFWTREMKAWLGRLGDEFGLRTIATRPGVSEFLLDLVWWQNAAPQGTVLACEMEWGNTRDAKNNPGRVLEDFEKLMSFKAPLKLMLFDSYSNSERQREMIELMEHALRDFADHRRGEEYLLFDVSPVQQAWHFAVRRDGADAQLRLENVIPGYGPT